MTIIGLWINSPEAAAADIGQSRTESVAQESEKPKHNIAVGSSISHDLGRLQFGLLLEHHSELREGKTPAYVEGEVQKLLGVIETSTHTGLRDRALLGVVAYTFAWLGMPSLNSSVPMLGRFGPQSVNLTSNACAPREEARPSVSPARYMTTPFPFVSLACILPSIRVSPLLMPW